MDVLQALKKRRAVHNFQRDRQITEAQWSELFEHVRLTPSGYNIQPWEFVVIEEQADKEKLVQIAFNQSYVADAAAAVVVVGDLDFASRAEETVALWEGQGLSKQKAESMLASLKKERSEQQLREMVVRNVGLVTMSLLLAAEDMGLASCPMMGFSKWQMRDFLKLPDNKLPGMLVLLGYEDENQQQKPRLARRPLSELLHKGYYGVPYFAKD